MRVAYLSIDEVNEDLAGRFAADCGVRLDVLWPRDPPPDGRFAAVLYDWDSWPRQRRQAVLAELRAARPCRLVALHGYHLENDDAEALRRHGVAVFRRLKLAVFQVLGAAAGIPAAGSVPGAPPASRAQPGRTCARRADAFDAVPGEQRLVSHHQAG